ncbi:MAG: EF-hand domain-containing protein [Proteobacteria bacterium]|nr:EF-hand domain-containing protein [Pseudomonadota bacterium]
MNQPTFTLSILRNAMRVILATALAAGAATAANAMPPAGGGSHVEEALTVMHQRFDAADSNHDGRISREEARQHMPFVYRNFDAIDTEHKGYVTSAQIEAYAARQAMARRGGGLR